MPNLTYARPQSLYAGSPVEEFKALTDKASEQYGIARTEKDKLDIMLNNLSLEERNNPVKIRAIENVKNRLKGVVESGNYQDAGYVVQDAKKAFMMDNELQDAIKSKALRDSDISQLQERLKKGLAGESGGITEKQYNYAMVQSKLNNQAPIKYNPDTMLSENMYKGINISDDLSQEIANQTFDRIKDWKANGTTTVDGKTYSIRNIGGVEKVMLDGKEVTYSEVANALKQDILNNDAYKRYLDESRQIDKFNKTFDSRTDTNRPMNRIDDLGTFTDEELKSFYVGADEKKIEDLRKSNSLVDKAALEEIKNKEKNFDLNNPSIVEQLHDELASKEQLNNVVYPAAEKASFRDFEEKIYTDQAALEGIKFRHAKELEALKKKLSDTNMPPLMQSYSQVNQFTGDDFSKKKESISELQKQVNQAKNLISKTDSNSSLYRTRVDDYNSLLGQLNIANSEIKNFYSSLPQETREKIVPKVRSMFVNEEGITNRDNKISVDGMSNLIEEAKTNKDYKLLSDLYLAQKYLTEGKNLNDSTLDRISQSIANNEDYLKIASDEDDKISNRSTFYNDSESGFTGDNESGFTGDNQDQSILTGIAQGINSPFKSIASVIVPYYNYRTSISNLVTDEYNKSLDQSLKLYSIPSMEGFEDKKDTPGLTKQFYSYSKNVLSNASDLVTSDGTPLDAVLAGKSDKKFYKINEEGKYIEALPDLDKTATSIATGGKDGVKRISNTYYDKEGKPLILSDGTPSGDKAARNAVIISARNPQTLAPLYDMASKYAAQTGNLPDAYELQGEMHFGSILNKARLGNSVESFEVNFPNGNSRIISFKKESDDASTVLDMTPTINGVRNPNYGQPMWGKNNSTFRSNTELVKAFEMSMYDK